MKITPEVLNQWQRDATNEIGYLNNLDIDQGEAKFRINHQKRIILLTSTLLDTCWLSTNKCQHCGKGSIILTN